MKTPKYSNVSVFPFAKIAALALAVAGGLLCPTVGRAVIVAEYTFTGSSLASSDSSPTSTASAIQTVGITGVIDGAVGNLAPSYFFSTVETESPTSPPPPIPVNSASDYFYFTVNPNATILDYGLLTMDIRTLTSNAVDFYISIQTSLNNYSTNVGLIQITGSASTMTFQTYSFDLSAFDASPAAQQFRVVLRDTSGRADRGLFFDNITLNTVPEPSVNALILGSLALGSVVYFVRRRNRRIS